jgi:hypothetical protein
VIFAVLSASDPTASDSVLPLPAPTSPVLGNEPLQELLRNSCDRARLILVTIVHGPALRNIFDMPINLIISVISDLNSGTIASTTVSYM